MSAMGNRSECLSHRSGGPDMGNDIFISTGVLAASPLISPCLSSRSLGIYARENGQGMVFDTAEEPDTARTLQRVEQAQFEGC